jgi:hypothetical protein
MPVVTVNFRRFSEPNDWRTPRVQVIKHGLCDTPPVADLQLTLAGAWTRRDLLDSFGEVVERLADRGLIFEGRVNSGARPFRDAMKA